MRLALCAAILVAITARDMATAFAPYNHKLTHTKSWRHLSGAGKELETPSFFRGRSTYPSAASAFDTDTAGKEEREQKTQDQFITADFETKNLKDVASTSSPDEDPCEDIVLDLQGNPLDAHYFAEILNLTKEDLTFSCSDAFRGLMSKACRIHLKERNDGGNELQTLFFKRIVLQDHPHALQKLTSAPYKLKTDIRSYQVVRAFLESKACQAVREHAGVRIPICYDSQLEAHPDHPIDSKFQFVLEDFSPQQGWYQQWLLSSPEECEASLTTLAKWHAFFWNGSSFSKDKASLAELQASVWPSGSYIQPNRNLNQCQKVAAGWEENKWNFENELRCFDYWDNLGERLQSTAEENGRRAHPFAPEVEKSLSESYETYRTLIHGDPKQANFLFRHANDDHLEVGLIDYQWCGFGLAATDIAHCLTSAVHADSLIHGGEATLLRYYHKQLMKYLVEYGAFPSVQAANDKFGYDTFVEQYETAVLDICRLVIAYAWSRFDPVETEDPEARARTRNKNSYNKWRPNVVWLMSRCDEIMKARGY